MTDSNLPPWPGAATVYQRVQRINTVLCEAAYKAAAARKRTRRPLPYSVPDEVREAIAKMGEGDEEFLKAYVARHLDLVLPRAAAQEVRT